MISNQFNKTSIRIFGSIILIIGIIMTSIIIKNPQLLNTKASLDDNPINLQITNVSDSQFSVSYTTHNKTIGTIMLGTDPNNLNILVLDDRDQLNQQVNSYKTHHISPKDLESDTTYYFLINSGKKTYLNNNIPFTSKTGPKIITIPPLQQPLTGDVKLPSGQNAEEGIVYLSTNGSQKISTLISKGKYILPLNNLLTENLLDYLILDNNSTLKIEAVSNEFSSITNFKYNQSNPIRAITLSNNKPQGGIETPTPSLYNNLNTNSNPSNTNEENYSSSPSPIKISENNPKIKEINYIENQKKYTSSSKNLSVIIFGLGVLLIVGSGVILLFYSRRKN